MGFSSDETPLWIFDLATARWSKFGGGVTHRTSNGGRNRSSPRGCSSVTAQPLGRRAHSAVLYHRAGVMSVYGGYQDFKGSSSELWTFHLGKEEMIRVKSEIKMTNHRNHLQNDKSGRRKVTVTRRVPHRQVGTTTRRWCTRTPCTCTVA